MPAPKHAKSSPAYRYGALPRDTSKPAPTLEAYLTDAEAFGADPLPGAVARVDYASNVSSWPMYLNDQLGDCTVAAMFHGVSAVETYAGSMTGTPTFSDAETVKAYSAVSGYDPVTGANDNGAQLQDVCKYMTSTGAVDIQGRKHSLLAWAEIENFGDLKLLKRVLNAFGTVYLAIQCPASAQEQFQAGKPWTYVEGSSIEGGHAIDLQYSAVNTGDWDDESIVTWGALQKMNEAFAREYIVEAVAIVPAGAVSPATGKNVAGLDLHQLVTDCQTKYLV
jgi:hypothetical protein